MCSLKRRSCLSATSWTSTPTAASPTSSGKAQSPPSLYASSRSSTSARVSTRASPIPTLSCTEILLAKHPKDTPKRQVFKIQMAQEGFESRAEVQRARFAQQCCLNAAQQKPKTLLPLISDGAWVSLELDPGVLSAAVGPVPTKVQGKRGSRDLLVLLGVRCPEDEVATGLKLGILLCCLYYCILLWLIHASKRSDIVLQIPASLTSM